MSRLALLALSTLLLSGCVSGLPDFHVRIDSMGTGVESNGYGHGVLVDSRTLVTVAHVVDKPGRYLVSRASLHGTTRRRIRYIRARYTGTFNLGRSVEGLSVLTLDHSMHCDRFAELRGIEPGDSGSPILGKRGEVVGLITGYVQNNPFFPGRTILGTNGPIRVPRQFPPKKRRPKGKK